MKKNNLQIQVPFDTVETIQRSLEHPSFQLFVKTAYDHPEGWAVRENPVTNKREMMVAGTRSKEDWFLNVYDYYLIEKGDTSMQYLDPWRTKKQQFYADTAANNGIHIVYGHSRGAALVADMPSPPHIQKVGLDGAMVLALNKQMLNIHEGGWNPLSIFDRALAESGENNVTADYSFWKPHAVWAVEGK